VRQEHVRAHAGLVRCGACRGIFDARLNLIEGTLDADDSDADTFGSPATIIPGIPPVQHAPTVDEIRAAAQAAIAPKSNKPQGSPDGAKTPVNQRGEWAAVRNEIAQAQRSASDVHAEPVAETDYDWRAPSPPLTRGQKLGYAALCTLVFLALLLQAAYWFRNEIASRFPSASPALAAACAQLGCRISPPRLADALGFVSSELAADAAHKGLHVFSATLRNTGSHAVAFPSLVLTLEGVGGVPIARRIFSPEQYAPANANLAKGLEGGADMEIKLYLDASPATPVGFKADHAYF
jgi:Protein of unknown function (DUF3426)